MAQGTEEDPNADGVAMCPGVHCATFCTAAVQQSVDGVVLVTVAGR